MLLRLIRYAFPGAVRLTGGLALAALAAAAAHAQSPVAYPRIETGRHSAEVWRLTVDQSERWLVTASDDKTARVWDLRTGQLERILRPPIGEGNQGKLFAVALSRDGRRVAAGGFTGADKSQSFPIYLFDRASGQLIGRSRGYPTVANDLSFSRDGRRLAVVFGSGSGMRILDAADLGRELASDLDCKPGAYGLDFDGSGRLVTGCDDGFVRLYDSHGQRVAKRKVEGGNLPFDVRFSPDGERIAVGFDDTNAVAVISGRDLDFLYRPSTPAAADWNTSAVAWSLDGRRLHAGGKLNREGVHPIVTWADQGRGVPIMHDASANTIQKLVALANGRVAFSSSATWGVIGPDGRTEIEVLPSALDHRADTAGFRVGRDGHRVEFAFNVWDGRQMSRSRARFDLATRTLETGVKAADPELAVPRTEGLPVTDWKGHTQPKFADQRLTTLAPFEMSRALDVAEDHGGFVLGTDWNVRSFDARGQERWWQPSPGTAWAVNQTADGRFVVAALGDGTIRWYDAAKGNERLALFIHARDKRWVLYTPEGFYQASPGGDALIGYHLNQGPDREGEFVDSAQLSTVFFRPDLITRRLAGDEASVAQALRSIGDVRAVLAAGLPPTVQLLSPAVADSNGEYDLRVDIRPSHPGARVGELKVFINGAEVQSRALAPPGGGTVTQRLSLAPGDNTVSVRALRADGKVASNEVVARVHVKPAAVRPVLRVLAVGISDYDDATFAKGVRFAARDADEVVRQLRAGAQGVYRDVDSKVLNRREETGIDRINAEIGALVKRARPEDVVVIFLAGHGKAPDGQYHFIPADFVYDSDQAFNRGRTLSHARLETMLKDLGAGKRLLILDTCDSGTATEGRDGATEQKDAVARLIRSSGRYILAAASPQGKALEDGVQGHGVYTYALLEGLAGKADPHKSGMIEVDALADYVSRRVPELTAPAGYRQRPMRSAQGENFPIVRRVGGQ